MDMNFIHTERFRDFALFAAVLLLLMGWKTSVEVSLGK